MDIELKEVERFGLVSAFVGLSIFIAICFWDNFCGVQIAHNEGYGWMQVLAMGGSGIYSMWALAINRKWAEYQKKIHNLKGGSYEGIYVDDNIVKPIDKSVSGR